MLYDHLFIFSDVRLGVVGLVTSYVKFSWISLLVSLAIMKHLYDKKLISHILYKVGIGINIMYLIVYLLYISNLLFILMVVLNPQ